MKVRGDVVAEEDFCRGYRLDTEQKDAAAVDLGP